MNIALLGATGNIGTRLTQELLSRGHRVTAIARHSDKLSRAENLTLKAGDLKDSGIAALLSGHDAVISAVRFSSYAPSDLIGAVKKSGAPRLLVVGGAGSLEIKPGVQLLDLPDFPAEYRSEAEAGRAVLNALKAEATLDWTYLSPSMIIAPGERTGKFRLGGDTLLKDGNGDSKISIEDFAIALVDELEQPRHRCQRFTVGY